MAKKRKPRVRKSSTKGWGVRGIAKPTATTLLTPSGKCPYILESTDQEDVQEWITKVTESKHSVITYDKAVYVYWLRHSFDINSDEYIQAKEIVNELVPERVKSTKDLGF